MNDYEYDYDYEADLIDAAYEPPDSGYCANCGEESDAKVIDTGIGPYEYGDERAVDVRLETVSWCCEDELLKEPPEKGGKNEE